MDPETQAGTDHAAQKEQARQAMLRASGGGDASTDAEARDDEDAEVVAADQADDDADDQDESEDPDADEADESADDPQDDDDDEPDQAADDSADVATPEDSPDGKRGKRRKKGKVARLYQDLDDLKAQNADLQQNIAAEVEKALAAKQEADAALAQIEADQAEDGKRIKQVRDYVHRLRGTDRELDSLTREIASSEDLDPLALTSEQRDDLRKKKARVNQILSARDITDIAAEYADADLRDRVASILGEFAQSLPGVDSDFHQKLKFGPAIQHVYDKAYERGISEGAATIAKHEKKIADLEGRLLAAKTQKSAPLKRVVDGGTSVARTPAGPTKPLDQMSPTERAQALGMIGPDGKRDPEFRKKVQSGLVRLVG